MGPNPTLAPALLCASLLLCACGADEETRAAASSSLEPATCGSIENLHACDGILLAGQPSEQDLNAARADGIRTVVNLRRPDEQPDFDERGLVEQLGMTYANPSFKAVDELTDAVLAETLELLSVEENKPLLLHCKSANRVGAIWLAHRMLADGLSREAALAEARTVGLKSPDYERRALEYVDAR